MRKFLVTALMLALSVPALAHAVVRTDSGTSESAPGKYETYRLQVPVEKEIATVQVKLFIPKGLEVGNFMPVSGWTRSFEKDSSGIVTTVTWKGSLEPMEFVRFLFSAKNPASEGDLSFVVEQTYLDGTVVAWKDAAGPTPASKVKIVEPLKK